jgi:hypothetical protein
MNDKKMRWALFWVTMFLVYIVLSTFNLLLSNYHYRSNQTVRVIGELTDIGTFNFIWAPGWLLGFVLGTSFGAKGTFIGQIITFLIGLMTILGRFKITLKELTDKFDNFVKRGS